MKTKSEVRSLIISFYNMIKTQFGIILKALRSDSAFEFNMIDFFSADGIVHQKSCACTPQQNSVVERKHQLILAIARVLKIQSHIPLAYWGECTRTAIHLINRLPSPLLHQKSPFEMLFNKLPSYNHLKVFGCLCYVSTVTANRPKFAPKACPCVFLGYPYKG